MKKFFLFLTLLALLFYIVSNLSYKLEYIEPDIDALLHLKVDKNYIEKRVTEAINKQNYDEAKSVISLANLLHIPVSQQLMDKVEAINTLSYRIKRFSDGFINGVAKDDLSLAGSVASDFTLVGDVRDFTKEGQKYLEDKPYDKFLLGISGVGIALGISTFATLGTSSGIKASTSIIKVAKKSGKLTKGFSKVLEKRLAKSFDKETLRHIDLSSAKSIKLAVRSIDVKPLKPILKNLQKIQKNSSISDTLFLLKYIDDEKDLQKIAKISQKYKKSTKAVFKVLGKSTLRVTKKVLELGQKVLIAVGLACVNVVLLLG